MQFAEYAPRCRNRPQSPSITPDSSRQFECPRVRELVAPYRNLKWSGMSRQFGTFEDRSEATIISFYSPTGGVGRTMAVANISWILASTGKHVLVVDWSMETPALEGYLDPFLVDDEQSVDADIAWRFAAAEHEVPHLRRREQSRSSGQDTDIMLSRYGLPHGRGQIDVIGGGGRHGPSAPASRPR